MKRLKSSVGIVLLSLLTMMIELAFVLSVYGEETELFRKYHIPKSLQKQPFHYLLRRMEWQADIALTGDWIGATQHPSVMKDSVDWSSIHLEFACEYKRKTNEYHVTSMFYCVCPTDDFSIREAAIKNGIDFFDEDDIDKGKIGGFFGCYWGLVFFETGRPSEFHFSSKMKFPDVEGVGCIVWDEKGNVIYDPYKKVGKDFWDDVFYEEQYVEYLKKSKVECEPVSTSWPKDYKVQVPDMPKNRELNQSLNRVVGYEKAVRHGNVFHLLKELYLRREGNSSVYVHFYFYKNTLAQVWVRKGEFRYVFDYGEDNRFRNYTQGHVDIIDDQRQVQPHSVPRMYKPGEYPRYAINGDGIEIKFHSTGYPASYKTIVRNRLFGRQIEWNDKGEVVSDVDLDIPQPWPDAPKRADEEEKN